MIVKRTQGMLRRQGNVAAMVACSLIPLMTFLGVCIDGGMLMSERRSCQSIADAAAMAASSTIYKNFSAVKPTGGGYNITNSVATAAKTAAKDIATSHGYDITGTYSHDSSRTGGVRPTPNQAAGKAVVVVNFSGNISDSDGTFTTSSPYSTDGVTKFTSSSHAGFISDGCVEVVICFFHARNFSSIWGTETMQVTCRAVAKGAATSPKNGVVVLNYTEGQALSTKGGGAINIYGGSFIVNSNAANAAVVTGGGAINIKGGTGEEQQAIPEFDVTGGLSTSGVGATLKTYDTSSTETNAIYQGIHPTPDPLAYLPAPTKNANQGTITTTTSGMTTTYTLTPGYYTSSTPNWPSGMSGFGADNVLLNGNGVYWFDVNIKMTGGTFKQQLTGASDGVMIYLNTGSLDITGSSPPPGETSIMLKGLPSQPTSTAPADFYGGHLNTYTGIVFWQPKTNTNVIKVTGNGGVSIEGTFYAPTTTEFTITGNGAAGTGTDFGSQFVVNQFKVAGGGEINVNYSGGKAARTRLLTLVE